MRYMALLASLFLLSACSSSNSGGGAANGFTAAGTLMTIDSATDDGRSLRNGAAVYYGRFMSKNGVDIYAGAFHFTLVKDSETEAHFEDFFLDRMVQIVDATNTTDIVTVSTDMGVALTFSATNGFTITEATTRFIAFALNFTDNSLTDITSARLKAFTGNNSIDGAFQGETNLVDAEAGAFVFGYDDATTGIPTAIGINGGFLIAPNKRFILGIDTDNGVYFAASR